MDFYSTSIRRPLKLEVKTLRKGGGSNRKHKDLRGRAVVSSITGEGERKRKYESERLQLDLISYLL